ncbi:hypothetical protein P3X46_016871 [Hevea brasiliensis]|uniref:HIT-type domain-containing protein n=1 Tax=Hevea brasiliensis TaxID=3981 RepID=A0ABQ9M2U1_HEVBR|nr:uncharacterized protein LOC110667624 [Hevea brasiliensis]KAJ9173765.1 hypothetical protein P3X46_016871 [Hevea brasiliensis]
MAERNTILTSEKHSTPSSLNPPSRIICHVCHKQFSLYTCPRCNSRYCSLQCFKSHSLRCTESFMRENVVEELQHMQSNDETKQKMLEILKRLHLEEKMDHTDEEDDCILSEETAQKILSGVSISLDDLSAEVKKRFQRAVASGELSKLIEPWDPWWLKRSARSTSLSKDGTQLVQPIVEQEASSSNQDDDVGGHSREIPPGPEGPLTPIKKLLLSTEPSPLLAVHLVDILYSYCFTLRLYNGDWQSDATGSAMVVFGVSSVLSQGGQPETVMEAVSYCLEKTCSPGYRHMGGLQFGLGLITDVISLLSLGGPAIICALCDLQRLIRAGEGELKAEKSRTLRRSETRNKLKLAERKVYFIMCWVHEQPGEAWSSLAAIVEAERIKVMEYNKDRTSAGVKNNAGKKGKVSIEEMS